MPVLMFGIFAGAVFMVQLAVAYRWFQPTANSISSFVAEYFITLVLLTFFIGFDLAMVTVGFMAIATIAGYAIYLANRPNIRRRTNVEALARDKAAPEPVITHVRPYQTGQLYDGHH